MTDMLMIVAQASQPAGQGDFIMRTMVPIIAMIAIFYFIMIRGNKKEQKRFQDMLANLKRNDRIQTIGGVLGTVVDVRGDEVVVKVDEANNVKMRFVRSAIKTVLGDAPAVAEKDAKK